MFHFRSRSFPARSGSLRVEGVFRVPGARRGQAGFAATALPSQLDAAATVFDLRGEEHDFALGAGGRGAPAARLAAAATVFDLRRKDHDLELGSGSQNEPAHPQMSGCLSLTFSPRLDAVIAGRDSLEMEPTLRERKTQKREK